MKKEIKIVGIIPARGGSKSIPYKNIAPVGGKPLIYYTIREAKKSELLDAFIVSTDDLKIAEVARSFGAAVPFLRPKKYAQDHSTDLDFLKHAVEWLEKNRNWRPEIVVGLEPTSPSRTGQDIDNLIRFMLKSGCDSARTVVSVGPYNPFKMWHFLDNKTSRIKPVLKTKYYRSLGTNVPRQLLPQSYLQVGLVYATKTKFIKKGKLWGPDIRGLVMDTGKFTDIDNREYLLRAEDTLRRLNLL